MMASTDTDPGSTVLVTGGTGYLGGWVVARLLAAAIVSALQSAALARALRCRAPSVERAFQRTYQGRPSRFFGIHPWPDAAR